MENAEEVFHFLEEFSKRKPKTIPQELNDYLAYVARTGDPVFQWSLVKSLFKEKLLNVITDFYETTPGIDIPPYPNVDPFNYDIMKNSLLERLDSFTSAPFTVQRICELLTYPRKQYNRIDKFMRAIEKNILVVSTREPGVQRQPEPENGEPMEPVVNGSDNNSEYNVNDIEMDDMSWKENTEQKQSSEPQPGSSDTPITVDDIEARLQAKQEAAMDTQEKTTTQYESVTPPELNMVSEEQISHTKSNETTENNDKTETASTSNSTTELKVTTEEKNEPDSAVVIPEIVIDTAEVTEEKLRKQSVPDVSEKREEETNKNKNELVNTEVEPSIEKQQTSMDENSSDSTVKEEPETKLISEISTSSEESSSSSDNTDGNSNSPKANNDTHIDVPEESNQCALSSDEMTDKTSQENTESTSPPNNVVESSPPIIIQSDNYSISDVNSELPQIPAEPSPKSEEPTPEEIKEPSTTEEKIEDKHNAENSEVIDKSIET